LLEGRPTQDEDFLDVRMPPCLRSNRSLLYLPTAASPEPRRWCDNEDHRRVTELGREAEDEIAELDLDEGEHFPALRRQVRRRLAESTTGQQIDELGDSLLA
jgi:hypothetical protein